MSNKPIEIEKSIYKDVINNVANQFDLPTKKLLSKDRYRNQVLARNMAYYILHTAYKQKAAQIAPYFKRDRTTILHGLNTFVNDIEVIPFYMEKYEKVMDTLFEPQNIYSLQ
jgi:chromosomal replication initiation ATPase DnaA